MRKGGGQSHSHLPLSSSLHFLYLHYLVALDPPFLCQLQTSSLPFYLRFTFSKNILAYILYLHPQTSIKAHSTNQGALPVNAAQCKLCVLLQAGPTHDPGVHLSRHVEMFVVDHVIYTLASSYQTPLQIKGYHGTTSR